MLPNAVWLSSEPCSPALYSCLHRSRQSPAPCLLSRHTTYPPRESVPTILDRRSRKGYVGNWPQSHLRRSTHFRETARGHRPATRSQTASRFPASPVVPPSRYRSPVSLCPPPTVALPSAAG